ncbi:MAG: B12-binding domain-containing radical SAM protein [Nitrospirae bacterium]|nr:B12-binding domain-containing radical SAM protein [Nitrospirota bacterium]
MFKVALISIDTVESYGTRSLSANLKRGGFNVHNIYFGASMLQSGEKKTEAEYQSLDGLLMEIKPDLIGISIISTFCHSVAVEIARRVKSFSTNTPVIFGGVHPTMSPVFCLQTAAIDYVCVGEGEESLLELCERLTSGQDASAVPGIMYKGNTTYIRRNPPEDLNELPFQDIGNENKYTVIVDGSVATGDPFLNGITTHFHTKCSRGCPFGCTYCSNANIRALYDPGKYLRRRSVDNVVEELKFYKSLKPGLVHVWFIDDTFPSNPEWVREFSIKYKEQVGIPFTIWIHPLKIKDENIALLKDAGLVKAMAGVESASFKTRREAFHRGETNQNIIDAIAILQKYGLKITVDMILDHPWESTSELKETFELVMALPRPFTVAMHSMTLLPNTELAKRAVREGFTTEEEIIANIVSDPQESAKTYNWCKGAPIQNNSARAYWIFLIMCAANPEIPKWFVKLLASSNFLKTYPIGQRDIQVVTWKADEELVNLPSIYLSKSALVNRLSELSPLFRRILSSKRAKPFLFMNYVVFKVLKHSKTPIQG